MRLSEAVKLLRDAGVSEPRVEARLIFTRIGKIPAYMTVGGDVEIVSPEVDDAVKRRCRREPLGYVMGEVDFYNESYKVTADTLIPRPDTEILVEYAVANIKKGGRFADLCTGSGCVAISVLKNTSGTTAVATDISRPALNIAKENSVRNGVEERIEFIEADVLSDPDKSVFGGIDALLSNPPYVTNEEYVSLEKEIYFEPKSAFVGGEDGGDFYRAITAKYKDLIAPDGFIAYEIGYGQAELLRQIANAEGMDSEIIYDLGGNPRVAVLKKKQQLLQ